MSSTTRLASQAHRPGGSTPEPGASRRATWPLIAGAALMAAVTWLRVAWSGALPLEVHPVTHAEGAALWTLFLVAWGLAAWGYGRAVLHSRELGLTSRASGGSLG